MAIDLQKPLILIGAMGRFRDPLREDWDQLSELFRRTYPSVTIALVEGVEDDGAKDGLSVIPAEYDTAERPPKPDQKTVRDVTADLEKWCAMRGLLQEQIDRQA